LNKIRTGLLALFVVLLFTAPAPAQVDRTGEKTPAPAAQAIPAPEAEKTEPAAHQASDTTEAQEAGPAEKTEAVRYGSEGDWAEKAYAGRVVDASTKMPIVNAPVTLGEQMVRTDADGEFSIEGTGEMLRLRAAGYARRDMALSELGNPATEIALEPLKVKALYLTVYGTASKKLRSAALEALERNNMNALVLDVKGDRGFIPFKVDLPLAEEIGAQDTILVKDYPALLQKLKDQGLYLIARIVVFKDDYLAVAKPQWAVKQKGGGVYPPLGGPLYQGGPGLQHRHCQDCRATGF